MILTEERGLHRSIGLDIGVLVSSIILGEETLEGLGNTLGTFVKVLEVIKVG
jgi:hypothetical protein